MPELSLRTRLVLVIHRRETTKTTNTGLLATKMLSNSRVITRGAPVPEGLIEEALGVPSRRALVLYPNDEAELLTPAHAEGAPLSLVVPDGSWRQASKVARREPALRDVTQVRLPPGAPSRYQLRYEHRSDGLATMEAIARALGVLEGPSVQEQIERVFEAMVTRTMRTRRNVPSSLPTRA